MKIKILFLIAFYMLLCSCGGLEETTDPDRRGGEPEGELQPPKVDIVEFTNWRDFLKNCKPEYDTPDNITDIIMGAVPGLQDYYLPTMFRACFKKKSQEAHEKICNARDYWERVKKNPKSPSQKARAENELLKLDRMEHKLNNQLYKLGTKARDQLEDIKDKEVTSGWKAGGKFVNILLEDEVEGWETVLDIESYSSCSVYTESDDDDD